MPWPWVAISVGRVLAIRGVAEGFLVAFTVFLYKDSLWSVPRWDHLVYLYEASQFRSAWELLAHAPTWNRAVSIGDHVEFRPLFHLMLGVEQVLFGRAYGVWQGVGIGLHALEALLLLRLGRRAFLGVWPPVLLSALFASLLLAAETVVWFHANAYILCATLLTGSLERLLAFLESGRRSAAQTSVLLALAATFTYEIGPLYCAVVGVGLVLSVVAPRAKWRVPLASGAGASRHGELATGLSFLLIVAVYAAISLADLWMRFGGLATSDVRPPVLGDLRLGLEFAVRQIGFWLGGLAFPALYDIIPGSRARFLGLVPPTGVGAAVNAVAVSLCLVGGAGLLFTRRALATSAPGLAAGVAFLAVYSLVVALGRSVPRGLAYTLEQNLQHAYPALLIALAAVILGGWTWRRSREAPCAAGEAGRPWTLLVGVGAAGLIGVNAAATMTLLAEFRHSYDAPRRELLHHVEHWHARPDRAGYFRIATDCPGHDRLTWFAPYVRHDTELVYFIDVIFPETSFNLARARLAPGTPVDEISCAVGPLIPAALAGQWREADRVASVAMGADGGLDIVSPGGARSPLVVRDRIVTASAWGVTGVVSHDARYIYWRGSVPWHR